MTTITVSDLVSMLPPGDDPLRQSAKKSLPGVRLVQRANPAYVEPELLVQQPIMPGSTSVVLLDAPGAVGKSTIAAEIAYSAGAFLWDLSKFQVGSRTFSGTIYDLFDFVAPGIQKRLREGQFLFVLDALDEAEVRAGSQNFEAFIKDLTDALKEKRAKPCVLLLARSDTAEEINLYFDEAGVPLARYKIEYFDKQRAISFIEKKLDARVGRKDVPPSGHRQQAGPFREALSLLFGLVYGLFDASEEEAWQEKRVKDFLGYAPVLEALADYLDVGNYMALIQELRDSRGATRDPWEFLTEIVARLSAREQTKVREAAHANLEVVAREVGWAGWDSIYTPQEQCHRILSRTLEIPVEKEFAPMPSNLARKYEESLSPILPQHPFLSGREFANVVFKEYVYAQGIVDGGLSITERLRRTMANKESPYLPTHLLSHFVENMGRQEKVVIEGHDLAVLYESYLLRPHKTEITIFQEGEDVLASFHQGDESPLLEIEIMDTGAGIHFSRHLKYADVDVGRNVNIGRPDQRFLMGPEVDMRCGTLSVDCQELEVDVSRSTRIEATAYIPSAQSLSLYVRNEGQGGTLSVQWPNLGYPWVNYKGVASRGVTQLGETVRGDTLRKFVMMFRRQRVRETRTLENARWSPDQQGEKKELLDLALRRGVLNRVAGRDQMELSSNYITLLSLVDDKIDVSQEARAFVEEYLGAELTRQLLG